MEEPKPKHLFKAAQAGDAAKLRELLAAGIPVDTRGQDNKTALMCAAESGQAEAFRVLVEAGADLHALALYQIDVPEA